MRTVGYNGLSKVIVPASFIVVVDRDRWIELTKGEVGIEIGR